MIINFTAGHTQAELSTHPGSSCKGVHEGSGNLGDSGGCYHNCLTVIIWHDREHWYAKITGTIEVVLAEFKSGLVYVCTLVCVFTFVCKCVGGGRVVGRAGEELINIPCQMGICVQE